MASWEDSKEIGDEFEEFIADDIMKKHKVVVVLNDCKSLYKYYDMTIVNNKLTIECKCDVRAAESLNFCIETHCNGNESGVLTSIADYWMITDNNKGYLIKRTQIERCIYEGFTSLYPLEPTLFRYMKNFPVKQENESVKLMNFYTIPIRLFIQYCDEVSDINDMKYDVLFNNDIKK